MPKIICTRPNASLLISGVNFTPLEDGIGIISEEISDEAAELLLSIPGYQVAHETDVAPAAAPKQAKTQAKQPKAAAPKAPAPEVAPTPAPAPAADETKPADAPSAGAEGDAKVF